VIAKAQRAGENLVSKLESKIEGRIFLAGALRV